MRTWKRIITAAAGVSLALSMNPWYVYADSAEDVNADFDSFETDEFVQYMEQDYTTMHFGVVDYSSYGITKPEANIGTITSADDIISQANASLDKLHSYDYNSLSDTQKEDYSEYEYELNAAIEQAQYQDLEMYFDPTNDVCSNIVTNMTEFVFRNKEDFSDYISVLKSIPDYLSQAVDLTKEQSQKGIFLTNTQLNQEESWLDDFVAKTSDNALITVFNNSINASTLLSDSEKASYISENQDIVLNEIIPAYQSVRDELEKMRGTRTYGDSVSDLPNGKSYYSALLKTKAGTDKSTEELVSLCESYLKNVIKKLSLLYNSTDESKLNETVSFSSPEEVLSYLQKQLSNEFPALSSDFTYHAEYLDSSVATDSVVAYYVNPPFDEVSDNSIKINGSNISDENELYETLAHEGIAGHMYQYNYYYGTNPNPLRSTTGVTGYTEGWAMYAETEMWQYSGLSTEASDYNALNTGMNYVLDAMVDLEVNGLGYTEEQVSKSLTSLGLNSSYASSLISYVQEYPTMLVPYGVGLAYFTELRNNAEDQMGSSFNATEFNTVLLNNGSRNFNLVSQDVDNYISGTTGTASSDPLVDANTSSDKEDMNWWLIGGIGAGLALVAVIAIVASRRFRKDDPFGA